MLDAVKNAKSLGVLFLIGALLGSFSLLVVLRLGSPVVTVIAILSTLLNYAVAIGLIMTKRWAVYALGVLILVEIISNFLDFVSGRPPQILGIAILLILIFAFFWFYSARSRFS